MSMFKVGDKIIFAAMGNSVMEYQQCLEMFISQGLIRHATPQEIAVGHRIDHFVDINKMVECEILDYPEDYTSPNCKKYDERSTNNPIQNIKVDKNKPA